MSAPTRKPTDRELRDHVQAVQDDPHSKPEHDCLWCHMAKERGITAEVGR